MSFWVVALLAVGADPGLAAPHAPAVTHADAKVPVDQPVIQPVIQKGGKWLYQRTANFRIWSSGTEAEARRLGGVCEGLRTRLRGSWLGDQNDSPWTPACDIVVHANREEYVRQLGPGSEQTSGCASIDLNSGRVVLRRVDLRGDATAWMSESLPHELTHVVLADRFCHQQISRWADEGMAILAEPIAKQALRDRDFKLAVANQKIFHVAELISRNTYPPVHLRAAFYGQCSSLVKLLVNRGTPRQFADYLELSMLEGHDQALREVYQIEGVAQLEQIWQRQLASLSADELSSSFLLTRHVAEVVSPHPRMVEADRDPKLVQAGH